MNKPCPHKKGRLRFNCDTCLLEDSTEALRDICLLTGHGDPSDGEGTWPTEIVQYVREALKRESLLDTFAGLAMQQMCSGEGARMVADRDKRYNEDNWAEIVADNAYNFAEAMLVERERRLNARKTS